MRHTTHTKNRLLGFTAAVIVKLFEKEQHGNPTNNIEFRASTQRIGIGFSEKIRDFWRKRWISVKPKK